MKLTKAIGTAAISAACGLAAAAAVAETTVNMINPLPRSTNFFPLVVGEELGYFAEEGVAVNLLPSDTSIPYVAFIQNGQADLAMLDPFETVNALLAGAKINTVFEAMQNAPEGIAVPEASDAQSVADLLGTTVGLVSDRGRAFLQAALATMGHTIEEVDTVVLGESGPTLAAAMRDGTVSAIAGAAPDWIALIANGTGTRLITPEEFLASPANAFGMNVDAVEDKRDGVAGFLRAWCKGMHAAAVNRDVAAEILMKNVPEEWEIEAAGQLYLDMSIGMNVSVTERCGDTQADVWTAIQPQMKAAGGIAEIVPVEDFLNDTLIAVANDFDRAEVADEINAWAAANM